jgi:hypothetical protein
MNPNELRLLRVKAGADLPVLWAAFRGREVTIQGDRQLQAPPKRSACPVVGLVNTVRLI